MADTYDYLPRYTRPDHFADFADFDRREYFVAYGRHRDSDEGTESNWRVMLARLGGESETVLVVRDSHCMVGWVEAIYIHESDTLRCAQADAMLSDLADYPILDDDDFSELEQESANQTWANCYNVPERIEYIRAHRSQFEFHDYADMIACIRGRYFAGYASELCG